MNLPHRDKDPIQTLYAHPFLSADLMRRKYKEYSRKHDMSTSQISINALKTEAIYFSTWLGFLAVVCEGYKKFRVHQTVLKQRPNSFQDLMPKCDSLGSTIKKHESSLRKFRNNVFHPTRNATEILDMISSTDKKIEWAHDLHQEFDRFFSDYRVLCEVEYFQSGRLEETNMAPKGPYAIINRERTPKER